LLLGCIVAAFCFGLVLFDTLGFHQHVRNTLLQKPDKLETRLHQDLKSIPTMLRDISPKRTSDDSMMRQAFVEMGKDNRMLRHEVQDLQQQSMIMAQVLKAYTKKVTQVSPRKPRLHVSKKAQRLALIDTPLATKWWKDNHPGGGTLQIAKGIQENPMNLITSEDPILDPYDPKRHYLRAPQPHDPASSLVKTVTGDYGSPMTYKDIVNNKRTIDWCVANFDFVTDREKCIRKINKGPVLM